MDHWYQIYPILKISYVFLWNQSTLSFQWLFKDLFSILVVTVLKEIALEDLKVILNPIFINAFGVRKLFSATVYGEEVTQTP